MAYLVNERNQGRRPSSGDQPADEIPYLIQGEAGDDDEDDALAAMAAHAPATLGDLKQLSARIEERLIDGWFLGSVKYGTGNEPGQRETGETSFSFDTTGGTFKVMQSRATVVAKGAGGATAPDLRGAINNTPEGPEGTDVTIPQYAYSVTMYLADELVTNTYKGILYALTGTKNNAAFKGLAAGENLFLGARGSKRGRGDWEIAFLFAGSPNATGLTVGDVTGINKKGWDYLWVQYKRQTVAASDGKKVLATVPQYVYVEKVYEDANHALLGIGT